MSIIDVSVVPRSEATTKDVAPPVAAEDVTLTLGDQMLAGHAANSFNWDNDYGGDTSWTNMSDWGGHHRGSSQMRTESAQRHTHTSIGNDTLL